MASFTPSQQRASQHQSNNSNKLVDPAASDLSASAYSSQCIDPASLSNEAADPASNNHDLQAPAPNQNNILPSPYDSSLGFSPSDRSNTSYTQQTTDPAGQSNHSYTQQTTVQQAYPQNYALAPTYTHSSNSPLGPTGQILPLHYQTYHNPSLVTYTQAPLHTTAPPPQQPHQESTQARQLAQRTVSPQVGMSHGKRPPATMQVDQSASLAMNGQRPTSHAMQRQPMAPSRNNYRGGSQEISPPSKPKIAPPEAFGNLMKDAQAHIDRLNQVVPRQPEISPPTAQPSTDSTNPPLSRPAPGQLATVVANVSTAQATHDESVDLTQPEPSNEAPQAQQEEETIWQLCERVCPAEYPPHDLPDVSGDQQRPPVDPPNTIHQATQAAAGLLGQSAKPYETR
ncbi:unnamed protein product [Clonostachys rosea]|uniref:Uncharacterized protein n=1 Tax=Bionectria ochroleuca TaxID=29856 RepID=A0ABY6UL39_BIOOC|nr:unnamed protein product [Clonostachys rosea]